MFSASQTRWLATTRTLLPEVKQCRVYSWGSSEGGVLGQAGLDEDGFGLLQRLKDKHLRKCLAPRLALEQVPGVKRVACGVYHAAALDGKSRLWTWGTGSRFFWSTEKDVKSRLGHGELARSPKMVDAVKDVPMKSMDCGDFHTAVVTQEGRVMTFGWGGSLMGSGALGHGDRASHDEPTMVQQLEMVAIREVACGKMHTLALSEEGEIFSWGRGENGRLGTGSTHDEKIPVRLEAFNDMKMQGVYAAASTSAALTSDGNLYMWGKNEALQLGLGDDSGLTPDVLSLEPNPTLVGGELEGRTIVRVALGAKQTIVCTDDGLAFVWGNSQYAAPKLIPADLLGDERVVDVAAGQGFFAVLLESGKLMTWGSGRSLCLGHANKKTLSTPKLVQSLEEERSVAVVAAGRHIFTITTQHD